MIERDPLQDPRPGDVVVIEGGTRRRVQLVRDGRVTYDLTYQRRRPGGGTQWAGRSVTGSVSGWRRWCRANDAQVTS